MNINGDGGYDSGYRSSCPFWDRSPSSLIKRSLHLWNFRGSFVLDAGCGEGKNAAFLASLGASVDAVDVSEHGLNNAKRLFGTPAGVTWIQADLEQMHVPAKKYDVTVCYGLTHCMSSNESCERLLIKLLQATRENGLFVFCAFNSRKQDLAHAHPEFSPALLPHARYVEIFEMLKIVHSSDEDLFETHPHNNIPHVHSMTRVLGFRNEI